METKKHIFTIAEKKYFMNILCGFKNIIENKETDAHSVQSKNNAWAEITREYNASPHCSYQASTKQLRRLWLNLKQRQRDALTKERQYRMKTGGGPAINDAIIDPDISTIAPALLVSVENPVDSDTPSEAVLHNKYLSQPIELAISTVPADPVSTQIVCPVPEYDIPQSTQTSCITSHTLHIPTSSHLHPTPATQIQSIPSTEQPQLSQTQNNPAQPNPCPILLTSALADRELTSIRRRQSVNAQKCTIIDKEFKNRAKMQSEIHELQKQLFNEQIREAKAKAALMESEKDAQVQIHELQKKLLEEQIREIKAKTALIESQLPQVQDPHTEH